MERLQLAAGTRKEKKNERNHRTDCTYVRRGGLVDLRNCQPNTSDQALRKDQLKLTSSAMRATV